MKFLRGFLSATVCTLLVSCGAFSPVSNLNNDFQIIREKTNLFQNDTGTWVSCSGLANHECIQGLDSLLAIRATPIFPTDKFRHIFIKKNFDGVNTSGFVDVDFAAAEDVIKDFLETQPNDFQLITEKKNEFESKANVYLTCSGIDNQECITGLDKMVQLSTLPMFPTDHFGHIFVKRTFDDVDTSGFVDVAFEATVDEIKTFLENQ